MTGMGVRIQSQSMCFLNRYTGGVKQDHFLLGASTEILPARQLIDLQFRNAKGTADILGVRRHGGSPHRHFCLRSRPTVNVSVHTARDQPDTRTAV